MNLSLSKLEAFHPMPGVSLWKKDLNFVYLDVNQEFLRLFGIKKTIDIIGKTDCDVPCDVAELAQVIQQEDRKISTYVRTTRYLEILKVASQELKMFLITKTPFYQDNKVAGTAAHCVEIPNFKFSQMQKNHFISSSKQASYMIIDENDALLTPREAECLYFLLKGKSAKETAELMTISSRTVEQHLDSLKDKFNCNTKLQLIAYAIENDYLNIIPSSLLKQQL